MVITEFLKNAGEGEKEDVIEAALDTLGLNKLSSELGVVPAHQFAALVEGTRAPRRSARERLPMH